MNTAVTSLPLQAATSGFRPWLTRTGAAVWRAFEETGRARAERHLLEFADHCEALQPELAKELRMAARHDSLS